VSEFDRGHGPLTSVQILYDIIMQLRF